MSRHSSDGNSPSDSASRGAGAIGCGAFRRRHSEYLDGMLEPHDAERWRDHAYSCLPCARFDRNIRRSCRLVETLPPVETGSDFVPRLQHRLMHLRDGSRASFAGNTAFTALSVLVAGLVAVVAWGPLTASDPVTVELPAVRAQAPQTAGAAPRVDSDLFRKYRTGSTTTSLSSPWYGISSNDPTRIRRPTPAVLSTGGVGSRAAYPGSLWGPGGATFLRTSASPVDAAGGN